MLFFFSLFSFFAPVFGWKLPSKGINAEHKDVIFFLKQGQYPDNKGTLKAFYCACVHGGEGADQCPLRFAGFFLGLFLGFIFSSFFLFFPVKSELNILFSKEEIKHQLHCRILVSKMNLVEV